MAAFATGGCSADGEPAEAVQTVTVEREVTVDEPPASRKKKRNPPPAGEQTPPAAAASEFVSCDSNIRVKSGTTTCPFAQNTFWTYWTTGEAPELQVWSPAAHASFATTCDSDGTEVTCTTDDGGAVKFTHAALGVYSQDQADAYASSHDLGPDPHPFPERGSGESGGDDCQGYDPCIEPGADVDCEGGSGDGPRYVPGPVAVPGDDPYGLDSDYDGTGCDS